MSLALIPPKTMSEGHNSIGKGTVIIHVRNTELAVCLLAVGILLREDPPYTHKKLRSGIREVTFNFKPHNADGDMDTQTLIDGYREREKFISENPTHPFTFAMCSVHNLYSFRDHFAKDIPYVGFQAKDGRSILYVKEGSRKHRLQIEKGSTQV